MLRRLSLALYTAMLLIGGLSLGATASSASGGGSAPQLPPTSLLTTIENGDGRPTLDWSLRGSSDRINVLPNLRCALGPEGSHDQFPATDPCLWLVDHLAPVPDSITPGCVPSREPDSGGPATYASWRCDMRAFQDLVIHAAQNANDRSFVMFNAPSTGGSGICARIPITVLLGHGSGELQAADGCPQTIRCEADYAGTVRSDALDTVSGCGGGSGGSGGGPGGSGGGPGGSGGGSGSGGGGSVPPAPGSGSKKPSSGGGASTAKGSACPGASSGKKGNSPLYSVYIKAVGKRGMKIYVHMRRAVPITVDVRMRRSNGTKVVRWVSRCAKKGKNVISFPNATGGAKNRRNYRVYVKSPNSTYPLRSSWEALPRR